MFRDVKECTTSLNVYDKILDASKDGTVYEILISTLLGKYLKTQASHGHDGIFINIYFVYKIIFISGLEYKAWCLLRH